MCCLLELGVQGTLGVVGGMSFQSANLQFRITHPLIGSCHLSRKR